MRIFRLARKKYGTVLSGKGAALMGNRWNSKGTEMIYTADSRALAMAEVAVHLTLATLPSDYVMLEIDLPDNLLFQKINVKELPFNWNTFPHSSKTQYLGDFFVRENKFLALQVPSAVVPGDFNYLLNPFHRDFNQVKIISKNDFPLDTRNFPVKNLHSIKNLATPTKALHLEKVSFTSTFQK